MMTEQDLLALRDQILADRTRLLAMIERGCDRRKAEALLKGLAVHLDIIDTSLSYLEFPTAAPETVLQR